MGTGTIYDIVDTQAPQRLSQLISNNLDPLANQEKQLRLKNLMQQGQMNDLKMQSAQRDEVRRQLFEKEMQSPEFKADQNDPDQAAGIRRIMGRLTRFMEPEDVRKSFQEQAEAEQKANEVKYVSGGSVPTRNGKVIGEPLPSVEKTAPRPAWLREDGSINKTIYEGLKGLNPRFVFPSSGGGRTKAPVGYRFSSDGETLEAIPGGPKDASSKPLPTQALKLQQAELDAIGTGASIIADVDALHKQVENGELDLGLISNVISKGRNKVGFSTKQSSNFNTFERTLEKMRNDSLRLNKGVQTEGDSQRAWNELMGSLNDPQVVKDRLAEIKTINQRAVNLRKMNVDVIRSNYGAQPLEIGGYENQNAAPGSNDRTASLADVQETARKSGRPVAEVMKAMKAKGFTVK